MPTLGELVDQVRHHLSGLDSRRESVAALRADITASDLTIPLDGDAAAVQGAGQGLLEIGLETIRSRSSQAADATVTVWPFGRGYRSTRATSHPVGSEVRVNPAWPAASVAREINGVLTEIFPQVYAVRAHETTITSPFDRLDVPAAASGVISVWVESDRNDTEWTREDRWYYNRDSSTNSRPLRIGAARDGDRVRVVYAAQPGLFDLTGSDPLGADFATVTGLAPRLADLLSLGVAARLAPMADTARLPGREASSADAGRDANAGGTSTRLLRSLFLARLEQEAAVLAKEHPIRVHRSR